MKQAERNAQTQQLIKEAFIHLINEKGFNSLTVSDITREAGVSRGTFYVHYTDKFELLTKIEDELIDNFAAALTANLAEPLSNHTPEDFSGAPYKVFNQALGYVNQERETMRALLSSNGHPQFFNRIKELVDHLFTRQLTQNHGRFSSELPIDYTKEIALNSILNIVRHWLDKDEPESPEELAEILMKSRFMAPHELITFN